MPKKTAAIQYQHCDPKFCADGVCLAVVACKRKVLKQDAPFEKPDSPMVCVGCGVCVLACQLQAVLLV